MIFQTILLKRLFFGILILPFFMVNSADAIETISLKNRFGLGAGGGFAIPAQTHLFSQQTGTDLSGYINFQYYYTDNLGLEVAYNHLNFASSNPIAQSFTVGGLYRLHQNSIFSPILGIGLGYGIVRNAANENFNFTNITLNGKMGLNYTIDYHWVAEIDLKWAWFNNLPHGSSYQVHGLLPQIGLTYFFYRKSDREPLANLITRSKDVNDSDGDGVTDDIDLCPNTPRGAVVNTLGCTSSDLVELPLLLKFDFGKAEMNKASEPEINKVANLLEEHADIRAEITVFGESVTQEGESENIANERALAIQTYLIQKSGIEGHRVNSTVIQKAPESAQKNLRAIVVFKTI